MEPYAAKTAPFYVGCICVSVNMTWSYLQEPPTDVNYPPYTCINNNIVLSKNEYINKYIVLSVYIVRFIFFKEKAIDFSSLPIVRYALVLINFLTFHIFFSCFLPIGLFQNFHKSIKKFNLPHWLDNQTHYYY